LHGSSGFCGIPDTLRDTLHVFRTVSSWARLYISPLAASWDAALYKPSVRNEVEKQFLVVEDDTRKGRVSMVTTTDGKKGRV
jgi:hypothetical protein